jgi:hypothetical protein
MSTEAPLGEAWGFGQMTNAGKGYWYKIGLGRRDDAGRALAKVITSPFKTFTGHIIICVHGTQPPGAPPDPSFPLLRRAGMVEEDPDADLGLMWGHSATFRNGKGYYEKTGVGWFDRQGRAHGRFHLTINTGFKGFIARPASNPRKIRCRRNSPSPTRLPPRVMATTNRTIPRSSSFIRTLLRR